MNVDLPEPEGPTRKTNSPLSMERLTSSRPTASVVYAFVTAVEDDHRAVARAQHGAPVGARDRVGVAVAPARALAVARGGASESDGGVGGASVLMMDDPRAVGGTCKWCGPPS